MLFGFPVHPLVMIRISAIVFSIVFLLQNIVWISLILHWRNIILLWYILNFGLMLFWMLLFPFFIHLEHIEFFMLLSSNFRLNLFLSIVLLGLRVVNFVRLFLVELGIILINILVILIICIWILFLFLNFSDFYWRLIFSINFRVFVIIKNLWLSFLSCT